MELTKNGTRTSARDLPFQLGKVLAGKYLVQEIIGEGGVGVVVAARHLELDEPVAIKFLRPEAMGDASVVGRFAREAKAAVSIRSEHVVRLFDVGTTDAGAPYFVMEYLEGKDLATALQMQGVFQPRDVAEYGMQVCEALAAAHSKGVVHRDIKPENLFLTVTRATQEVPCIKVLDFGISKAALTGSILGDEMPLVKTVNLMGTPLYMSPERIRRTENVDARSDIWSLGMVLYEMLAGTTAFTAASITELCAAILEAPIAPILMHRADVPRELVDVINRCLEKDPAARYQNVAELAIALMPVAPKRARICAERAASMLRASGHADPNVRVESTAPPPSLDPLRSSGAIPLPPAVPTHGFGMSPMVASMAVPEARRRSKAVFFAAGAALLLLGGVAAGFLLHQRGDRPIASDGHGAAAAEQASVAAETPRAASPTAQAPKADAPRPGAAASPLTVAAPVTPPAPRAVRPVYATRYPAQAAAKAATPPVPAPAPPPPAATSRPKTAQNEEPDLGY